MVFRKQKQGKDAQELEDAIKLKMETESVEPNEESIVDKVVTSPKSKRELLEEKIKQDKEELERLEKVFEGDILVVKELPTQEIRQVKKEDGTLVNLITIEEALTKLINE